MESVRNKDRKGTQYVAVRFGNVLGSNGSVIPLFKKQIESGGPVTVTHPDIVRYFMTIPEAVSLVLQAGELTPGGGEIFVLDMGEPVKIDSLARNLIKLSGYEPDIDIPIEYTGLRPGEKLYEEKLMAEEGLKKTDNELIHIGKPIPFNLNVFLRQLEGLAKASYENSGVIVEMVEKIVPTFHPTAKKSAPASETSREEKETIERAGNFAGDPTGSIGGCVSKRRNARYICASSDRYTEYHGGQKGLRYLKNSGKKQIVASSRLQFPDVRKDFVILNIRKQNQTKICLTGQSGEAYPF